MRAASCSCLSPAALMHLGCFGEAHDFLYFLRRASAGPAEAFQVLYGLHGERDTREEVLAHLEGYRGSKPVRIGNGAAAQKQLDVYGELLDCPYQYTSHGGSARSRESFLTDVWPTVHSVAEYVVRHWREPDRGIWEMRAGERHFVHAKAMCWVALDRALKLARVAGVAGRATDFGAWQRERDAIYASVLRHGFEARVGTFVQSYGSTALDASILLLPMLGVIEAADPRIRSTIAQIERRLMRNGLVYRYLDAVAAVLPRNSPGTADRAPLLNPRG